MESGENIVFQTKTLRKAQKRRVVQNAQEVHQETTDLESERMNLIRRNQEMLSKLGVTSALLELQSGHSAPGRDPATSDTDAVAKRRVQRPKRKWSEVEPARRSSRVVNSAAYNTAEDKETRAEETCGSEGRGAGMTQEEYLASKGTPLPEGHFRTDGHFKGWVNPQVAKELGLAASAAEAWEQGGGGKFNRRVKSADVPAHLRSTGWSTARAFAASQLHKNPNAYFYRHNAPGCEQGQGEWTEEEHQLFLKTARHHGVGDKWGLFASYIPNRVGYQCSAYYTQVLIPSGMILDPRYRLDSWGSPVYVGPK